MHSSRHIKIRNGLLILLLLIQTSFSLDIIAHYDTLGYARNVCELYMNEYYVLADSIGATVFNDDGLSWTEMTPGCAYDVRVFYPSVDPVLVVADGDNGLQVFISDTGTAWFPDSAYSIPGKATSVEKYGSNLIFVGSEKGLFVYDFSNPVAATLIFTDTMWCAGVEDIVAEYGRAAVLSEYGMQLVNIRITDTDSVYIESVFRLYGDTCGVEILIDTMYIVSQNMLYIVAPTIESDEVVIDMEGVKYVSYKRPVSVTQFSGHGTDISTVGRYAFISVKRNQISTFNGVLVYDISDRKHPVLVDSCTTPGTAEGLYICDDSSRTCGAGNLYPRYVYCASGEAGVVILDYKVAVSHDNYSPSIILEVDQSHQVRLSATNAQVFISLPKAITTPVSITIRSLNGRTVRSICPEAGKAGKSLYFWDFRDNSGNVVPSGIYYIFLQMNGYNVTKPFVKLY